MYVIIINTMHYNISALRRTGTRPSFFADFFSQTLHIVSFITKEAKKYNRTFQRSENHLNNMGETVKTERDIILFIDLDEIAR